jgi:hypothetical protein
MVAGSVTSAALPGAAAWDIVVGDRFIAALAAPAPDACTTALAEAASDARVSIETLVGCIPVGPAVAVDSFAIVWWPGRDPSEVTAVVRGDAVVDLTSPGGTRRFDAHGIRPWHLADFSDVAGLRITAADAPLDRLGEASDAVRHPRASLRASSIEWAAPAPRPDLGAAIVDADTLLVPRSHQPSAEPPTPHSVAPEHPIDDADTILTLRHARSGPATGATTAVVAPTVVAPIDVPPSVVPPADDALVGRSTRPIALAPVPPVTDSVPVGAPPPAGDLATPRAPRPASFGTPSAASTEGPVVTPPTTVAAPARSQPVPAFRISGGPPHPVTVPVLIGRRPLAPRIPGVAGSSPELVTVDSPQTVISSTHLELRLEGSRLIATDLRSTNGTIVRSPSGVRRMRAGESIVVAPGTSLDLGDDTIIEILLAPAAPAERSQIDSRPHP